MSGIALVISGPAGVGKTTLCDRLLDDYEESLSRIITVTTRKPRQGEIHGKDYIFKNQLEFKALIKNDSFIEYARIHENYYGSLKKSVSDLFGRNQDVLLNIDVQGAKSLKDLESKYIFLKNRVFTVFVLPPQIDDLRIRLNKRGLDSPEEIDKRLKTAVSEISFKEDFDFVINSKSKSEDYLELKKIYLKCSNSVNC